MERNLKIGLGQVNITPPIGISLMGYFFDRKSVGIHDEIYAKTILLDDGKTKAVIICCDLADIEREMVLKAKGLMEKELGISSGNVLIHSTHTHTGPVTKSEPIIGTKDEGYLEILPRLLLGSVISAKNNLTDAKIGFGSGREENISFNRRYLMKDGKVRTNPGYNDKNIVRAMGPIDPEVGVMKLEDKTGNLMGLLVNFACHPDTVGGNLISADYPGVISKMIKKMKGNHVMIAFANGTCGNINHCDRIGGKIRKSYFDQAKWMGTILGGEVLKVCEKIECQSQSILKVAHKELDITARIPSPGELRFARRLVQVGIEGLAKEEKEEISKHTNFFGDEVIWAKMLIDLAEKKKRTEKVDVQVIRVGNSAIVSLPGEVFVEFGLRIKKNSKFKPTLVAELNSLVGYIPTEEAFSQNKGYEQRLGASKLVPEAGDLIANAAISLLKEVGVK